MTVEEYIKEQPIQTQAHLKEIREIIFKVIPNATEMFNYNIPAFALVEGGKREEQIMMAGYKNHIGFYPHPTTIEKYWDKLSHYKKAKGSVQFPLDKPLPKQLILDMVKYRFELVKTSNT